MTGGPATGGKFGEMLCDVCVIGGGAAGLSAAAGAVQLGARVVLIERAAMGGDCLNRGCVPSKALIAAAGAAWTFQSAMAFGVGEGLAARIDFKAVHDHVHGVIAAIAPHDSVARFEALGVTVLKESARFIGPREVEAGPYRIRARRFALATGSRPLVPRALRALDPLTNETIFDLVERPEHLLIVGGGPVGLELAQAFRRLGARVSVVARSSILARDEPEAAQLARETLKREGVALFERAQLSAPRRTQAGIAATIVAGAARHAIAASHILVAAGREIDLDGLGLAVAGVESGPAGLVLDQRLRSTNSRIFALGDVAGGPQFTHVAGYHAGIFIRNALFGLPARLDYAALPWVTYLDPEIAHVGLTEAAARAQAGRGDRGKDRVRTLVEPLAGTDRARTERREDGFIKLVLTAGGKVLGATIVAPHAGEMIGLWGLVIAKRTKLSAVAAMIVPYPTLAEISKQAAGSYFKPKVFGAMAKTWVGLVQKFLP